MSFQVIPQKLLESAKTEINKPENMNVITHDIIHPIVSRVLEQLYPYLIGISALFIGIVLMIVAILFLNIKICYKK